MDARAPGTPRSWQTLPVASKRMNPDKDRAVGPRTQALSDQVEGLERWVAGGRTEQDIVHRLTHTRAELAILEASPGRWAPNGLGPYPAIPTQNQRCWPVGCGGGVTCQEPLLCLYVRCVLVRPGGPWLWSVDVPVGQGREWHVPLGEFPAGSPLAVYAGGEPLCARVSLGGSWLFLLGANGLPFQTRPARRRECPQRQRGGDSLWRTAASATELNACSAVPGTWTSAIARRDNGHPESRAETPMALAED